MIIKEKPKYRIIKKYIFSCFDSSFYSIFYVQKSYNLLFFSIWISVFGWDEEMCNAEKKIQNLINAKKNELNKNKIKAVYNKHGELLTKIDDEWILIKNLPAPKE